MQMFAAAAACLLVLAAAAHSICDGTARTTRPASMMVIDVVLMIKSERLSATGASAAELVRLWLVPWRHPTLQCAYCLASTRYASTASQDGHDMATPRSTAELWLVVDMEAAWKQQLQGARQGRWEWHSSTATAACVAEPVGHVQPHQQRRSPAHRCWPAGRCLLLAPWQLLVAPARYTSHSMLYVWGHASGKAPNIVGV